MASKEKAVTTAKSSEPTFPIEKLKSFSEKLFMQPPEVLVGALHHAKNQKEELTIQEAKELIHNFLNKGAK